MSRARVFRCPATADAVRFYLLGLRVAQPTDWAARTRDALLAAAETPGRRARYACTAVAGSGVDPTTAPLPRDRMLAAFVAGLRDGYRSLTEE